MVNKEVETKVEKIEREYVIPLREKCRPVPRYKKTPKAIKTIKEFLVRHMKIRNGDLKKIKLDMQLNEYIWGRGIKRPMHKVKVKAIKEGDEVRVELFDVPDKLKFKKIRLDKREAKAQEGLEKKKGLMEKLKDSKNKKNDASKDVVDKIEESIEESVKDKPKKEKKDLEKEEEKVVTKKKVAIKNDTEISL